jgi:hypothetical protein
MRYQVHPLLAAWPWPSGLQYEIQGLFLVSALRQCGVLSRQGLYLLITVACDRSFSPKT